MYPGVKTRQTGAASEGVVQAPAHTGVGVQRGQVGCQALAIVCPNLRAALQPALEVAAPKHLLHKLLGALRAVQSQRLGHHLLLGHQPAANVG